MVKRVIVSISIFVAAFLILAQTFAARETKDSQSAGRTGTRKSGTAWARRAKADVNSVFAGVKSLADPNAISTKLKQFNGLESALENVNKGGRRETRGWMRDPVEGKLDLAETVNKQIVAEFAFIRELAVGEGAGKTVAAIDGLLLERQERFRKVLKRIETAMRKMRREGRDQGQGRGRYRDRDPSRNGSRLRDRSRYQEMGRDRLGDRGRYREGYQGTSRDQYGEWGRTRNRQDRRSRQQPYRSETEEEEDSTE